MQDSKEQFYYDLHHKIDEEQITSPEFVDFIMAKGDTSGFYELCAKFTDISLNAPKFPDPKTCDMSLVGTRPPLPDEYEKYDYHHRARLAFKPGITGMWQVSGRSDITDFEEVVKLDTDYINNWSLGLDIKILARTVVALFSRKGAM